MRPPSNKRAAIPEVATGNTCLFDNRHCEMIVFNKNVLPQNEYYFDYFLLPHPPEACKKNARPKLFITLSHTLSKMGRCS